MLFLFRSVVLASLIVLVTVNSSYAAGKTAVDTVKMTNNAQFLPGKLTITQGNRVVWINTSDLVHTVTCDRQQAIKAKDVALPDNAKAFDSGKLNPGNMYSKEFSTPGIYRYFCIPHEALGMTGEIIVKKKN
ncbi:MAG TPA: plastocyanin/azurin family copper-binding protein [Sunxiuqinia sp.]|nr:plastocyanin/azurin family copper-binding protein [Sunxiuqinia sp.]